MGIEPTTTAWKAVVLPLNYTRKRDLFRLIGVRNWLCFHLRSGWASWIRTSA
jgi:hypothetical protein